ncbi:MAG: chemotaxis protein CheC [Desulfobacterales bacterium]|nr:chemotaxis protein CheC [Desulfobacterales bacterium]MBF0397432.1 chemotaxis protein CheC [Desulfobacterales bacterium]
MFDDLFMSELTILARHGAENASLALSRLMQRKFLITVNEVKTVPIQEVPESLGESDAIAICLFTKVEGDIEGDAILILKENDALNLIEILGGDKNVNIEESIGEMELSMLQETANITISSFMNTFMSYLNKSAIPSSPIYIRDLIGSILSVIIMESAEESDNALLFSTQFECKNKEMEAMFIFLPSPSSLKKLKNGLTNAQ